jgi:nickel-dependent lactate racemase
VTLNPTILQVFPATINQNHTLLLDERSRVGSFENNPVRQDIEQIGELIEVNYALNAVLNYKKEIIEVFFGKPSVVITKGVELSKKISMTQIDHPFDLVIASAGGYPKDINFYQSQKALTHASLFCKNGGTVLLFAECEEGVGNEDYVRFMQGIKSHTEAIEKFTREGFSVGPHKAYQTAKIAGRIKFQLVSSIQPSVLDTLLIQPVKNLDLEVHQSIVQLAKNSTIAIIPFATNTIPYFKEEK